MADITSRNQGNVSSEGKQNWRGDQVNAPQGGQSIYETSDVDLAQLGSRKVVGDRVFRYARVGDEIEAGEIVGVPASVSGEVTVTAGGDGVVGAKVLTIYSATALSANELAEGYVHVQSGTAKNTGYLYRVKSHDAIGATSTGELSLYDPIQHVFDTADSLTVQRNLYNKGTLASENIPAGIAPVYATTNEYLWLQTWGPASVLNEATGTVTENQKVVVGTDGAAELADDDVGPTLGYAMQPGTNDEKTLVFLTIAP